MPPTYQLVEDDQVTGPHSLAVLREKVAAQSIRPDTPVRAFIQPPEPWRAIRDWPELNEQLFVAKKTQKLGVAHFQATNLRTDAESAPVDVIDILRGNAAHERNAVQRQNRGAKRRTRIIKTIVVAALLVGVYWVLFHLRFPL